jgi:tetratricopeptide (TPR) repeat protein
VVFEDLHWIDGETQALLDSLVDSLGSAQLLLLVNYRPEYEHRWGSKTAYSQLRLDSLPAESTAQLLEALLGPDLGLESLKQMLLRRGNPFFLEETVRTLVETGGLVGDRGAYRLTRPVEALQIPTTVQAVLATRIDRLPAEDKRLLQTASVIGKDVPYVILQAIAELPEAALERGLAHLQQAEFLYEARLFPDLEYTFKHALTHEVAYGSLLQQRRQEMHAQIVGAIERSYPERLVEQTERLAHHAFRGQVWDKAVRYFRQAGAKAFERSANREAVTSLEQALDALRHLPATREALEQAIDLRFDLRNPLNALGELGKIHDHLRESERLAATLGDQRRLGRVATYLSSLFNLTGKYARGVEFGERALAVGEALNDLAIRAVANVYIGTARSCLGDYSGAVDTLTRTIDSLTGDLNRERFGQTQPPAALARGWKSWSLAFLGRFAEAIACGEEMVQIAEAVAHPYGRAQAMAFAAHPYLFRGDLDRATVLLEESVALFRATGGRAGIPFAAAGLGYARALTGRRSEGLALLGEALAVDVTIGQMHARSLWVGLFSEACLMAGLLDNAIKHAAHALDLSRGQGARGWEAWSLRLLGEINSHPDARDAGRAQDSYRGAITLAMELGMRPLVAHCHLGLGKLYASTGRRDEAKEHLNTATTMYREMDMRFWLAKAEVELSRTG